MRLKPHDVLSILPPLSKVEIERAAERVRLYGQRDVIEVLNGRIVSGLEEYEGCLVAKVKPKLTKVREPEDLVEYVCRRNVPRNLSPMDRACVAVLARAEWQRLAKERMRQGGSIGGRSKGRVAPTRPFSGERWFEQAARILGASANTIKVLARVHRDTPDVFQAVRNRKILMLRDTQELAYGLQDRRDRAEALKRYTEADGVKRPLAHHVWNIQRERNLTALDAPRGSGGTRWVVHEGALETVGARIPDGSIDAILTDIPYGDVEVAGAIGQLAKRVLREGCVLAMLNGGKEAIPILNALAQHLEYVAIGALHLRGKTAPFKTRIKGRVPRGPQVALYDMIPIYLFSKGTGRLVKPVAHLHFEAEAPEKGFHVWQKELASTADILKAIVDPGCRVLDPCAGSGTTGVAALQHGGEFIGIDIDPKAVQIARRRLADVERDLGRREGVVGHRDPRVA